VVFRGFYEIGAVDYLPFVSHELVQGGSLADRLGGTPQPGRQAALLLGLNGSALDLIAPLLTVFARYQR